MKKLILFFSFVFVFNAAFSQASLKTYKVGIFAPVYLDSVFAGDHYRYTRSFPRFTLQGLEFFQGAMIALDSLKIYNGNIDARFFDTRSYETEVVNLVNSRSIEDLDLIIGSVKDEDFLNLSAFALKKNIPFISATYPNDAGITTNPFTVIVNSTLKAHCEAIFAYLLGNHGMERIYLVSKEGSQEERIRDYFKEVNEQEGKPLIKLDRTMVSNNDFSSLIAKLDSTKENIIIGGSLDATFAADLVESLAKAKNKKAKVIGMPNWDGFASNKKMKDYPVYFTTPYFNFKNGIFSGVLRNAYNQKYKGNPSDMAHKGFESVYVFADLITRYPESFMSHLNDYGTKVFSDFNFKPVFNKNNSTPDYFENKHLYFVKALNGSFSLAW